MKDDAVCALRAYLGRHFAGAKITVARAPRERGYLCTVEADGERYRLTVFDEAFSGPGNAVPGEQLEAFRVAQVMRDMAGFPVTVTQNGCIAGDV